MKKTILLLLALTALSGCNKKAASSDLTTVKHDSTTVEKIASRAGYAHWNEVQEIAFTFNVGNAASTLRSRQWTWNLKTNDILLITSTDTLRYNRKKITSPEHLEADKNFINDSYWLLPEFKFLTDKGTTIMEQNQVAAPISADTLDMMTVAYSSEGGYTPGDAYDVYYDKSYQIKEWVFRKGNDTTTTLMTTFEKHTIYNGLTIATDHRLPDGDARIYFTNINVTTK